MRRVTRVWATGVLAILAAGFLGCSKTEGPWQGQGGPPRVLVSFPPLYSFTKSVAGKDAAVLCLMVSQGPHEHITDQDDALKFQKADVFLMNGLQLEKRNLVDRLKEISHNQHAQIVELGKSIPQKELLDFVHGEEDEGKDEKEGKEGHKHEHEHEHDHGQYDPHVWLGIPEAIHMVEKIRDELVRIDPPHRRGYEERAADYVKQLKDLQAYGKKALAGKKNRKLVAMHDSLRYFARTFDLQVVDSIQPRPGVEADPKKLANLVQTCKKENVRVIAVEPQYQEGPGKVLARELKKQGLKDVEVIVIDPLETAARDLDAGFYVRKMRENIDTLKKALQ